MRSTFELGKRDNLVIGQVKSGVELKDLVGVENWIFFIVNHFARRF